MKRNPFDRMEDAIIDFQGTTAAFTAIFDGNAPPTAARSGAQASGRDCPFLG